MNILEKIIEHKRTEIAISKRHIAVEELKQRKFFTRDTLSLKRFLLDDTKTGIIAEFKRKSPSKGVINSDAGAEEVTGAYTMHGASGLSVLTDEEFFGGAADDLTRARIHPIPILRKDFIIDEYQLLESRAIGADVILLIAACLTADRVKELASFARSLQLEVLLEIHTGEELQHICDEVDLVGVNNRDLKTFSVDINRSIELSKRIPVDKIKIAESGIDEVETVRIFKEAGFKGFLIGEKFMKTSNPGEAFKHFVEKMRSN
ncbi:MAG TPA: indole-3-glycerol phosphate synthase TrpC [Ferruginibacter sp.]|nr:indole-3-glycerol phosphate synthase TrpC [Ferruginibacter sp.]